MTQAPPNDDHRPTRRDEVPSRPRSTAPGPPTASREPLPRGLMIVLVAAAIVVVVAGMRAIPGILGPVFLALVLTILVDPIRGAAPAASRATMAGVDRGVPGRRC